MPSHPERVRRNYYVAPSTGITVETIAAVMHEANRALCLMLGEVQPSWADAPEWQVKSAIQGVFFHMKNPDADPDASHCAWMESKLADGWNYGPVKDADTKRHPCLVPFDKLPPEQQAKDVLVRAIIHALLPYRR